MLQVSNCVRVTSEALQQSRNEQQAQITVMVTHHAVQQAQFETSGNKSEALPVYGPK